jgi:hypothetical protein
MFTCRKLTLDVLLKVFYGLNDNAGTFLLQSNSAHVCTVVVEHHGGLQQGGELRARKKFQSKGSEWEGSIKYAKLLCLE